MRGFAPIFIVAFIIVFVVVGWSSYTYGKYSAQVSTTQSNNNDTAPTPVNTSLSRHPQAYLVTIEGSKQKDATIDTQSLYTFASDPTITVTGTSKDSEIEVTVSTDTPASQFDSTYPEDSKFVWYDESNDLGGNVDIEGNRYYNLVNPLEGGTYYIGIYRIVSPENSGVFSERTLLATSTLNVGFKTYP